MDGQITLCPKKWGIKRHREGEYTSGMPQQESRDFGFGSTRLRTPESILTWPSWSTRCPGKKLYVGQKAWCTEALGAWAHNTLTWVSNLRMGSSLPEKPENWGQEQRAHPSTGPPTCETVSFQLHLQPWAAERSNGSKPLRRLLGTAGWTNTPRDRIFDTMGKRKVLQGWEITLHAWPGQESSLFCITEGKGGELIYLRVNINHGQTVSKGGLLKVTSVLARLSSWNRQQPHHEQFLLHNTGAIYPQVLKIMSQFTYIYY